MQHKIIFFALCALLASSCSEKAQDVSEAAQIQDDQPAVLPAPNKRETALEKEGQALIADLEQTLSPVEGTRGVAVLEVGTNRLLTAGEMRPMAQQSVSKLWVSMTIADMVAKGQARYTDPVTVTIADRAVFHQPLARRVANGPVTTTVGQLMEMAITHSDNMANSVLIDFAGGPGAVQSWLMKNAPEIRFGPGDRVMQPAISGLQWNPVYGDRMAFERARNSIPSQIRQERFSQYANDPVDGASPDQIVEALAALRMGRYPGSNDILSLMARTQTGHARLKAGIPEGWRLLHKTGTGPTWKDRRAGFNDVGLLEAPSGRSYAVAVMIGNSSSPQQVMQQAIAGVAKNVAAYEARTNDCCAVRLGMNGYAN